MVWLLVLAPTLPATAAQQSARTSKSISSVLREPLPPEELRLSESDSAWTVIGPTFTYSVHKTTGAITELRVQAEGQEIVATDNPVEIILDDERLVSGLVSNTVVQLSRDTHQIVLRSQGLLRKTTPYWPDVDCTMIHTFFDDGVVVTRVRLVPRQDWPIKRALLVQTEAQGPFSHYLHKRRDEHGESAERGPLPGPDEGVLFSTLTSCLQVFGHHSALALFTDSGATSISRTNLVTAEVRVGVARSQPADVCLRQYVLHRDPRDKPYVLKAGEPFDFRVGLSVAPNRLPPPRRHDLRMFAWIGDERFPYPTDREIEVAAQYGYTLFQMHRLGTPGEPRPPAGELDRVIRKVHESGMLFLWTENADLMYDSAPGVQELKATGQFSRWQGFNYGGRYKAAMDPYCDLVATCLASPNGLADYRLATIRRMLDRFAVDGIYLDDNLAYPNCPLWQEHGHPRPVYDCLIELHEMNWRRRQVLRERCPHLVLVSHNTRAIVLPVLCDFDAVLYGEGYSFGSIENYWDYYLPVNGIPAQGMIWPGGQDPVRCAAAVAYNYDLLTGGGQYCYIDWRLFPEKFPHGAGVTDTERLYVQTYNLAQYYFGLYESKPYYFAKAAGLFSTRTARTYATIYHNQVWGDCLIALANMNEARRETALEVHSPQTFGIAPEADYLLFDVIRHKAESLKGRDLNRAFGPVSIPGGSLQLYCLRALPPQRVCHLWGGKRISEEWDAARLKLTLTIQGPCGVQETIAFADASRSIEAVWIDGNNEPFFHDPTQGLAHGTVTFGLTPLRIEVLVSRNTADRLPTRPLTARPLAEVRDALP